MHSVEMQISEDSSYVFLCKKIFINVKMSTSYHLNVISMIFHLRKSITITTTVCSK